ncbi:methyltransferase [Arthrobacter sp.]|uniref:methyltransferase family protein n=1 Tax=Arthrobacter sp. TaxID=1667 RepID=UPI002585C67E|nr:methyltransferase [Arthrobacter sp.]
MTAPVPPAVRWGRAYFALQSVAGLLWWTLVPVSPLVRHITLGSLDPALVAVFDLPLFVVASGLAAAGSRGAALVNTAWTLLVTVLMALYATVTTEAGWGVVAMAAAALGSLLALSLVWLGRIPFEWVIRGPLAFRPADRRRTTAGHVGWTFTQLVVVWGLFLGVFPLIIRALEDRWKVGLDAPESAAVVGWTVFVLASLLGICSAVVMSSQGRGTPLPSVMPNELVIAGPYRWVRNPMALAGVAQAASVGLILGSWLVVVYAVGGALLWNVGIRPLEERDLEARFGNPYRRYRATVRCWIPRWPVASRSAGRPSREG